MSTAPFQELLCEYVGGSWFSYTLSDNRYFLQTAYKVMYNQEKKGLLTCRKLLCNGQIELLYDTEGLFPLEQVLNNVSDGEFLCIATNLFSALLNIQETGFLSYENVYASPGKIFVDTKTWRVSLLYLPLSCKLYNGNGYFMYELRTLLINGINQRQALQTQSVSPLYHHLSDENSSLQDLYRIAQNSTPQDITAQSAQAKPDVSETHKAPAVLCLVSTNRPSRIQFQLQKERFVIGRNPQKTDGCITNSKAVGREHCEIVKRAGEYYVTDLNSTNGTFLNEQRLQAKQEYALKEGDRLRIADTDFQMCAQ